MCDKVTFPSPLNPKGYYEYPGQLGQARGWKNVPGMTRASSEPKGSCVDEWTGGRCTNHYMTLGGGPMKMTVAAADDWCNTNSSCHGFTFETGATSRRRDCHFTDTPFSSILKHVLKGEGGAAE